MSNNTNKQIELLYLRTKSISKAKTIIKHNKFQIINNKNNFIIPMIKIEY